MDRLRARTSIDTPKEKQCPMCGVTRSSSEFSPDRGRRDGLTWYCKGCRHDLAYTNRSKKVRGWLANKYGGTPCFDCKEVKSWECMQFDHLDPATKTIAICDYKMNNKPTPEIIKILTDEIAGCEIVCGNCHASRTVARATSRRAERQAERDAYAASKITRKRNEAQ